MDVATRVRMLVVPGLLACGCGAGQTAADPGASTAVLYLNFGGAQLHASDQDDASDDAAGVPELVGPQAAYAEAHACDEVAEVVREHFSGFELEVVCARPTTGPYTMVLVSTVDAGIDTEAGLAWRTGAPDCGNDNPSNVGVVEVLRGMGVDAPTIAMAVSHVAGIGFGLDEDHDFPFDLASFDVRVESTWVDMCFPLFDEISCPDQNVEQCGSEEMQNSYRVLASVLGER